MGYLPKKYNVFRFSIDMNLTVSMQSNIICWQGNVHCWITGKYGLNFEIQNLNLQSKAQSEKQIPTLRNVSFFWKSEKGFEKKLFTSTVFSQVHTHYQQKKRTLFHENSFVNPFLHSNQMTKKESNITQSILRTEFSEVKTLFRFSILIAKSNTLGTRVFSCMQREFSVLAEDQHIFGRGRKVSGTQGKNPKSGFQNLNPDFDVMLLLMSPSWLIFFPQHRAVRQLKSNTAQQLEVETKKMEERIRALKEQMFKEKEERE